MHIGIISGYFNPLHAGHLEYINAAKQMCNFLIVIVNNDDQVTIKNSKVFMDQYHRSTIIQNLKNVDLVIISTDKDSSVSNTLKSLSKIFDPGIHQLTFYNSGDRNKETSNKSEIEICQKYKIKICFIDLPKIYSSSEILK